MCWCKPNKNGSVHLEVKNSWKVTSVIKKHCPPGWYYNAFPQTFPTGVEKQTCACAYTEVQPTGMVTLGLAPWSTSKHSREEVGSRGGSDGM